MSKYCDVQEKCNASVINAWCSEKAMRFHKQPCKNVQLLGFEKYNVQVNKQKQVVLLNAHACAALT